MTRPDSPFVIPASDLPEPDALSPAEAEAIPEDSPEGAAMQGMFRTMSRGRSSGFGKWLWAIAGSLFSLMISIAAYEYVNALMAQFPILGKVVLVLMALLALALLIQILREYLAWRRLGTIDRFRTAAAAALVVDDLKAAHAVSDDLQSFYYGREDLAWAAQNLSEQRDHVHDADAVIALTERALFTSLDQQARREIEAACRTVAGATALIPLALVDVMAAMSMNVRMIRRIAEIYGARSGFFGSVRLLRSVVTHLLATGLVAVGDDMISSVAGGGAIARVSRRFGEGVINGALTARVGIAAIEVCRPLPFSTLPRPGVSGMLSRALAGLFPQKAD